MMALAPIVITTSVLTIILQIILIILVLDTKKKTNSDPKEKPLAPDIREARKPREQENRFAGRRPPLDQRPKPSPVIAPVQNTDPVERSLRDINLRLKNAERDQEKERRRIKDTIAPPQHKRNDFSKPRERNEGFRRNDRPRQDFSQQRPSPVREERPVIEAKEIKPQPLSPVEPPILQTAIHPVPPQPPVVSIVKPADQAFEMEVTNSLDSESLQHGRKIMVKRRVLKDEDEQAKDIDKTLDTGSIPEILPAQISSTSVPPIEPISAVESKNSEDPEPDVPISFGR